MGKTTSVEDFKLVSSYEAVKSKLLREEFSDRLSKPLGYWVLPNDRRLPLAFLGRSIGDLLSTPFEELSATPGIGQKKISSLVKLLQRATNDQPPAVPFGATELTEEVSDAPESETNGRRFDPSIVSEALWAEWQQAVRKFDVGDETLGRLAPSLQTLPTVIWHTPLRQYLNHTVGEIRRLRTHGEKRVRCVLEVFHSVYGKLMKANESTDLQRLLTPDLVLQIQDWVSEKLLSSGLPSDAEVQTKFAEPMLKQISIDSGATVHRLAEERLGVNGEPQSVRSQSRNLGVTRARIYQLLDDCAKVMSVRWPDGKAQLDELTARFSSLGHDNSDLRLFFGLCELCFPEKQPKETRSYTAGTNVLRDVVEDVPAHRESTASHF